MGFPKKKIIVVAMIIFGSVPMTTSNDIPADVARIEPEVKWSCTTLNVVKFRYIWSIKNFSFCQKELKSPVFSSNALDSVKWQISTRWQKQYLSLHLHLVSTDKSNILIKLTFSILISDGTTSGMKDIGLFSAVTGQNYGLDYFIAREDLEEASNGYLRDDSLIIVCDIAMMDGSVNSEHYTSELKTMETTLSGDLSKLLDNGKFSDVTLIAKNTEFQAHKAILASRSDVFAAMFEHELEESKTNRVVINDFDVDVVEEMLRFIYTGGSPNLDKMAGNLLAAADKYVLEDLKHICISVLGRSITIDTVVQTLILADLYNANLLKVQAIDFINANASSVLKTEDWKQLKIEYPRLGVEIYERWQRYDVNALCSIFNISTKDDNK